MSDIPPPRTKCLPFELIENILSRLPVKSLKLFRAVEKAWCRLIDSEKFAKTHLHRSLTSSSNRNLYSGVLGFHWINVNSLDKVHSYKPGFDYNDMFVHSLSNSCNGLVVVMRNPEPLVLWNLFTREHKVLPECPSDFSSDYPAEVMSHLSTLNGSQRCSSITRYGFGYDSRNDDYKVVQVMTYMLPPSFQVSVGWIYSLKSNSWRRTKGTSYERGLWDNHVNGALHTILQAEPGFGDMKIMAFSLDTEEEYELMLPRSPGIELKGLFRVFSTNLDGCYALACDYPSKVVIWVMKEYGVQESWTPLASFPVGEGEFLRPLAYSKESDKIVLNCTCKKFVVCGARRRTGVEKIAMPQLFYAHIVLRVLFRLMVGLWEKARLRNRKRMDNPTRERKRGWRRRKGMVFL